jgi:hypothetical protein
LKEEEEGQARQQSGTPEKARRAPRSAGAGDPQEKLRCRRFGITRDPNGDDPA